MRNLIILLAMVPFLLGASCKKDDGLTKVTQNGANTFSCKINGKVFLPKEELFSGRPLYANIATRAGVKVLDILAKNTAEDKHIIVTIENFSGVGTYQMGSNQGVYVDYLINVPSVPVDKNYTTKNSNIGRINITRSDNNVVSGTFEFTCLNEKDSNDRAIFSDGRFDIRLD